MTIDTDLFFARRLGVGLRPGEQLPAKPREWALDQLRTVPPFGYFDASGTDLAATLPLYAKPTETFADGSKNFEVLELAQDKLDKASKTMEPEVFNAREEVEIQVPYIQTPVWRAYTAGTLTAVNGNSGVFERFYMFWTNHFAVKAEDDRVAMYWEPHRQAIRNRMTGKFADLLYDAVINPAMLTYLDNVTSTGPHSPGARDGKAEHRNLNENLGRELLELHSLSPAAGYTQKDVTETALTLTGWSRGSGHAFGDNQPYGLFFISDLHEPGTRTVLGKKYPPKGKGENQIRDLINDLAVHPATAQHLAFKLARAFIADDPPKDSVDRIAKAYLDSGGDLIALHSATVEEVLAVGMQTRKMTTPENWIAQAYRATGAKVPIGGPTRRGAGRESMYLVYRALGQPFADPKQPNGFPDTGADWISREMLDRRVRQAYRIGTIADAMTLDAVKDYAARLAGSDSPLVTTVSRAESRPIAVAVLLASSQFLKI